MNYIKITKSDIANGPGVRTVLWVSGCKHHCKECHNPETWNISAGKLFDREAEALLLYYVSLPYIAGLTLSGGDPLHPDNKAAVLELAHVVKRIFPKKSIWMYTGYMYEELDNEDLKDIDVLVDGEFHIDEKDISLPYCGSRNQRVIDVKASREQHSIVLFGESL